MTDQQRRSAESAPLRILHVDKFASRSGGGAPTYMLDLVQRQRARGHDVEFLATDGEVDLDTKFRHLFPERIELSPPPEGLSRKLRTVATMLWSRRAADSMTQILEEFEPDVVHCHNLYHQLSPSILAPIRSRGIRCVMTVHDYKLVCPTYKLIDGQGAHCESCVGGSPHNVIRRRCQNDSTSQSAVLFLESGLHRMRRSYDPVETFLCPSAYMAGLLRQGGFGDRAQHLPLGYDLSDVPPRIGTGTGVAFGGRLAKEKGVDHLIRAVALMPGVSLTICGDGPERATLEQLGSELLGERVKFLGHVSRSTLLAVFAGAGVIAAPSVCAENQPISILDALASAVPVVAGDSAALRELVRPGVSGFTVDPRDHVALAEVLNEFESDEAAQRRIGQAARRFVEERHDVESHLAYLDALYRRHQLEGR